MRREPRPSRFGEFGDRFARTFFGFEQPGREAVRDHSLRGGRPLPWEEDEPRFAITRQGYDPVAVDQHIAGLQDGLFELGRELAELRAQGSSKGEVAAEIERVGEQTSAILIAAHEQAQETTRLAREEADRCIADAASNAVAVASEANRNLRAMETEKASLGRERECLLEDIRGIASALTSLADNAAERFPPDSEHASPAVP